MMQFAPTQMPAMQLITWQLHHTPVSPVYIPLRQLPLMQHVPMQPATNAEAAFMHLHPVQ